MRKLYMGAGILILLLLGTLYNVRYLDSMVSQLQSLVEKSEESFLSGDNEGAMASLNEALAIWEGHGLYEDIFIRHSEIDGLTYAFYETKDAIVRDEYEGYQVLLAHLENIKNMEKISLGSIF